MEYMMLPEEPEYIRIGEKFLSKKLMENREEKGVGMQITYYVISMVKDVKNKHYEYMPCYDVLEE